MDDETLHKAADAAYGTFYPNTDPAVTGKAKAWKGDPAANPMLRPLKAALAVIDEDRPDLEKTVKTLHSAIWAYFEMHPSRPAQAEELLRSALPDNYSPVGA